MAADQFPQVAQWWVTGLVGDPAALGGAVTRELCGHWEHEGPCRWPHHTSSRAVPGEVATWLVTVRFDAAGDDEALVRRRIADALATGTLTGPDGTATTWSASP